MILTLYSLQMTRGSIPRPLPSVVKWASMAYLIHADHQTLTRVYAFVLERRKGIHPVCASSPTAYLGEPAALFAQSLRRDDFVTLDTPQ